MSYLTDQLDQASELIRCARESAHAKESDPEMRVDAAKQLLEEAVRAIRRAQEKLEFLWEHAECLPHSPPSTPRTPDLSL